MTTEQFVYWLQGYFELSGAKTLNEEQVKIVKDHIALVLKKETPNWYIAPNGPHINPDKPSEAIRLNKDHNVVYVKADGTFDIKTHLSC